MKKIIIALITALLMVNCANYKNKYTDEVLDGVFQLRLGMTEEELRAVVDTSQIYEKEHAIGYKFTYNEERLKKLRIREYIPISRSNNTPLPKYKMKDISVRFLDDKIYYIEFSVDGDSMKDILISKYGKPKVKSSTIKSKGQYTVVNPAYKETTHQYGDTYKTVEYPESSTIEQYTNKIKYNKYRWKTNDKDIDCTFLSHHNNEYSFTIKKSKLADEISSVSMKEYFDDNMRYLKSLNEAEKKRIKAEKAAKAKIIEDL